MLLFSTENHISRILVSSTNITPLVIRLIFSTENVVESHVLQLHNKMFMLSTINIMLPKYVQLEQV